MNTKEKWILRRFIPLDNWIYLFVILIVSIIIVR